jgi:amidase
VTAGPITKTARDLAHILDVIIDPAKKAPSGGSYVDSATGSWEGIRIGVLKPEDWYLGHDIVKYEKTATDQINGLVLLLTSAKDKEIEAAYSELKSVVKTVRPVTLISLADATSNGDKDIGKLFGALTYILSLQIMTDLDSRPRF